MDYLILVFLCYFLYGYLDGFVFFTKFTIILIK